MSRRRSYKQETLDVQRRFFEAIDELIRQGKLRGVQTYCRLYGIDKRHLYSQRLDPFKGFFEVAWFLPLLSDFKVSYKWLLFGKGEMLKK